MSQNQIPPDTSLNDGKVIINNNVTDSETRLTSAEGHVASTANPHGITASQAGALTQAEADALYEAIGYIPAWAEITEKPTTFAPSAHKTSHAIMGADALSPADIGAKPASYQPLNYQALLETNLLKANASAAHTMTLGAANAGSTIASSVAVQTTDARLKVRGGAAQPHTAYPSDLRGYGITYDLATPHFEMDFMYDGGKLELQERGSGQRFTSLINNSLGTPSAKAATDGSLYHRLIDFGSSGIRRVRFRVNNLVNIKIEPGATLWATPPQLRGGRTIMMGDSFAEGTGGFLDGGFAIYSGLTTAMDAWASGVGATGIINDAGGANGRVKFRDRVQNDVIAFAPDAVIIAGGLNDRGFIADGTLTIAAYRAEYDALLAAIRTGLPQARIVVLGPFWPRSPVEANIVAIRDANRDAALAAGADFIDVFYFTDANKPRYISADGTHPNDAGHEFIGKRLGMDLAVMVSA